MLLEQENAGSDIQYLGESKVQGHESVAPALRGGGQANSRTTSVFK